MLTKGATTTDVRLQTNGHDRVLTESIKVETKKERATPVKKESMNRSDFEIRNAKESEEEGSKAPAKTPQKAKSVKKRADDSEEQIDLPDD